MLGPGNWSQLPGNFPKLGWLFPAARALRNDTVGFAGAARGLVPSWWLRDRSPSHSPQLEHRAAPATLQAVPSGLLSGGWEGYPTRASPMLGQDNAERLLDETLS